MSRRMNYSRYKPTPEFHYKRPPPKRLPLYKNNIMSFGKYKGRYVKEVLISDPAYLIWVEYNSYNFTLSKEIKLALGLYCENT